jgi:hypothetical protein
MNGGLCTCPFSNFYFLLGRWLGGRACDKVRAGQAGPGAASYGFQGADFVFDFLLRVAHRERRENRFD